MHRRWRLEAAEDPRFGLQCCKINEFLRSAWDNPFPFIEEFKSDINIKAFFSPNIILLLTI